MSLKWYLLAASVIVLLGLGIYKIFADLPVPKFLNTGHGRGDEATAQDYYKQVGGVQWIGQQCQGQRCTLAGWKSANGFGGGGEVSAVYYNEGELGLARDVHCREVNPVKVACYVTNYGSSFPADPLTSLSNAAAGQNPRETLAMEAARSFGHGEGDTWFFVYSAAAGNALVPSVQLDNEGEKFVPNICQGCHGGEHSYVEKKFVGGTMLPFDVFTSSVLGPSGSVQKIGAAAGAYQEAFRQLNGMVLDSRGRTIHFSSEPPTYTFGDPIRDLIVGWYDHCPNLSKPVNGSGLGGTTGCGADDSYLPPLWAAKPVLYQTVVRRYCRSCHSALDNGIEFTAWSQFEFWGNNDSGIPRLVCNIGGASWMLMPNAEQTYARFWSSSGHTDLATQLGYPSCMQ